MNYCFLVTYLPDIRRDDRKIKLGVAAVLDEKDHIAASDWKDVELVLLRRDVFILERLLSGKDVDVEHAIYGKEFWKDQAQSPKDPPMGLEEFLLSVKETGFGPRQVDALYEVYVDHVLRCAGSSLLRAYVRFDRDVRNVAAATRARRLGRPAAEALVGTGEVVEQLGRSTADDFGLGAEMPWIERLRDAGDPVPQDDAVEEILWNFLEERVEGRHFEFDVVLAYLLRLQLLERRLALSEEHGRHLVQELETH